MTTVGALSKESSYLLMSLCRLPAGTRRRSAWGRFLVAGLLAVTFTTLGGSTDPVAAVTSWLPEHEISDGSRTAAQLVSALSDDGTTAVVAWRRSDGTNNRIEVATASIGVGGAVWTTPLAISEAGRSASDPSVAISADGSTVLLAWDRSDGSRTRIQAVVATVTAGVATWGSVATLSTAGFNSGYVDASLDGDGALAFLAWQRYDGSYYRVDAVMGTIVGGVASWGSPALISGPGTTIYTPEVALARNGDSAGVVWESAEANRIATVATTTTSGLATSFGGPAALSAAGQNADDQLIAIENGVAIATWLRYNGSHWIMQTRSAAIGAGLPSWEPVIELSASGQPAKYPALDMDATASHALAAWIRSNGTHDIVQVRTATLSAATVNWSPTADLSLTGHSADHTDAAIAATGSRAAVVWERPDDSGFRRVQISVTDIVDGQTTWGAPLDLSTEGENASEPLISLSGDGETALAVWSGESSGILTVRSRVLVPTPAPVATLPPPPPPPTTTTTTTTTVTPPTTEPPVATTTAPEDSETTSPAVEMLVRVADSLPVVAAEDIVDGPRIDADAVEARVGGFEARETVYGAIGPEIVSAVTAQADESGVVEMRLPVREARSAGAELILYAPVSGRGGRIPLTVEPAATIELPATGFDPTWSLIAALAVAIGLTLTLRRRIL